MSADRVFDREQLRETKRRAIIREAAILFNEHGYDGTSLDQIADQLGVTKKALYYYVDSKQEILQRIIMQWVDAQKSAIDKAESEESSGLARISAYAHAYVADVIENLSPMSRVAGEMNSLRPDALEQLKQHRRENDRRLAEFVAQGIDEGAIGTHDPGVVVKVVNGSLDWMFKWFSVDGPKPLHAEIDAVLNVIFLGLEIRTPER